MFSKASSLSHVSHLNANYDADMKALISQSLLSRCTLQSLEQVLEGVSAFAVHDTSTSVLQQLTGLVKRQFDLLQKSMSLSPQTGKGNCDDRTAANNSVSSVKALPPIEASVVSVHNITSLIKVTLGAYSLMGSTGFPSSHEADLRSALEGFFLCWSQLQSYLINLSIPATRSQTDFVLENALHSWYGATLPRWLIRMGILSFSTRIHDNSSRVAYSQNITHNLFSAFVDAACKRVNFQSIDLKSVIGEMSVKLPRHTLDTSRFNRVFGGKWKSNSNNASNMTQIGQVSGYTSFIQRLLTLLFRTHVSDGSSEVETAFEMLMQDLEQMKTNADGFQINSAAADDEDDSIRSVNSNLNQKLAISTNSGGRNVTNNTFTITSTSSNVSASGSSSSWGLSMLLDSLQDQLGLSTGVASADTNQVAIAARERSHPLDNDLLVIFIQGGITFSELCAIEQTISAANAQRGQSQKKYQVIVGSSGICNPFQIMDQLL
jgi:hypothetical protein